MHLMQILSDGNCTCMTPLLGRCSLAFSHFVSISMQTHRKQQVSGPHSDALIPACIFLLCIDAGNIVIDGIAASYPGLMLGSEAALHAATGGFRLA